LSEPQVSRLRPKMIHKQTTLNKGLTQFLNITYYTRGFGEPTEVNPSDCTNF
jgi:hypothetical protein